MTHKELVEQGRRWLKYHRGSFTDHTYHSACGVILTEFHSLLDAIPDVIGFGNNFSVVIECKVSHNDFLNDFKKQHRYDRKQCGNFRYYLSQSDIITPDEVPYGWGLLVSTGKTITMQRPPIWHDEPEIRVAEYHLLYSIARRATLKGLMPQLISPLNH